jgi:hypothetical protein
MINIQDIDSEDRQALLTKQKNDDFEKKYYWCYHFQKISHITDPLEKYSKLGLLMDVCCLLFLHPASLANDFASSAQNYAQIIITEVDIL